MDYSEFVKSIHVLTGINLELYKEKQNNRRIDNLMAKIGVKSYGDYIKLLKSDKKALTEFLNTITVNVSEFYRNPDQWEILHKEIIPGIISKNKFPNIWSAACSTGDEPYTLVMVLAEYLPITNIKIIATDIDDEILMKARAGVYQQKSLESLPKKYLDKYFEKRGEEYVIKNMVKRCVEFRKLNLLKDPFPSDLDLIVCRNVLIYFKEEVKAEIYLKFNNSMKQDAVLFIGSTEQILRPEKYGLKSIRTFFFKKEVPTSELPNDPFECPI